MQWSRNRECRGATALPITTTREHASPYQIILSLSAVIIYYYIIR